MKSKERLIQEKFLRSEEKFEDELTTLIKNRIRIESKLQDLLNEIPLSNNDNNRDSFQINRLENSICGTQISTFCQIFCRNECISGLASGTGSEKDLEQKNHAATVIQTGVRRWLIRRRNKRPIWSRDLLQSGTALTERKIRRIQDEIELWQQKNKVSYF